MEKVILGTGSYDNVKSGNRLSITGDGGKAWGYTGNAYKKLAPKLLTYVTYAERYQELLFIKNEEDYLKFRELIENEYIRSYYELRLKDLNVNELLNSLKEIYGNNIILLCHEDITEFCHRRLVADYIELKTGIYIPEIKVDEQGNIEELTPIRYTKRLEKVIKGR